ncbi:MAG: ABC transporter permease subunit [Streptomyces sp.]|nr:ABC transporter permease subunit [Streptomyces sp.]
METFAGFGDVLKSEYAKLRSLRSTAYTLAAAALFTVVLAAVIGAFVPPRLSAADRRDVDAVQLGLGGMHLAQVAIGVLGVLAVTGEYGSGTIRTTFSAVPRRRTVLTAKAVVVAGAAAAVGTASCFGAFYAFEAFLTEDAMSVSLGDPGVLRAVAGGGLYLAVLALLGLGLGAVLRSSAGATATLLGLLFVPALLVDLLPPGGRTTVGPYLPMQAGTQVFVAAPHEAHALAPWTGFAVFSLYAAAALAAGLVLVTRRDA